MGHLGGVVLSRWVDGMEWVHVVSWDWRSCDVLRAFTFGYRDTFFLGRYIGNRGVKTFLGVVVGL